MLSQGRMTDGLNDRPLNSSSHGSIDGRACKGGGGGGGGGQNLSRAMHIILFKKKKKGCSIDHFVTNSEFTST